MQLMTTIRVGATIVVWTALCGAPPTHAGQLAPAAAQTPASTAQDPVVVIRSQYRRLPFTLDIQRIAVADTEIVTAELITSREVLVLGRETGRTTLIVWFANG